MKKFCKGDKVRITIRKNNRIPHSCRELYNGKIGTVLFKDIFGVCVIVEGGFQDVFAESELSHANKGIKYYLNKLAHLL
jgi:ribosomal protein L21E